MNEEERWTMHGMDPDDPECIHTVFELEQYIEKIGFLPLFRNEIPGFSVEEHTPSGGWWSGDPSIDPWEWRGILAARGNVAYGKFFNRTAGFISREWFPVFANYRRDGYDFDARWDDELASMKSKKIMDLFAEENQDRELFSFETKELSGYGKGGEKNFEGEITSLQMQTYLCIREFRRRKNKSGQEYGWGIAVYCTPEHLWGYDHVTGCYQEDPKDSEKRIFSRVEELYPGADERSLRKVLGIHKIGLPEEKKVLPYPDNLVKALRIENLSADSMSPDQLAGLEVAVGQLRDRHQKVLEMKYREHKKNDEIGQAMNRAAGTISTYHTKAMQKLKWPEVSCWYLNGYDSTLRDYLARRGMEGAPEVSRDEGSLACGEDLCLRIGLSLKQFEGMYASGMRTVSDLKKAVENPRWYVPVRGIGAKTAKEIEKKLQRAIQ